MKIKCVIKPGEFDYDYDTEDFLTGAAQAIDASCVTESIGDVLVL